MPFCLYRQWLPRHKLEPLGQHEERDESKLLESRKTSMRKSVMQAYERAIIHRDLVERGGSRDSDDDDYDDAEDDDEEQRVNENGNEVEDEEDSDNEDDDIDEREQLEENGFV